MILVTGMHRSGTSLVAMTLEALGVPFGPHEAFYAADRWNARGYYERRDVMDINSRMISGFGRTGSRLTATIGQLRYLSEPPLANILARGHRLGDGMRAIGKVIGRGAIKDPRLCLTWSAWAAEVPIRACIVSVRYPIEVAASLWRRQRIPAAIGLRFWRYHIRALKEMTPEHMAVVNVESLIDRPGPVLGHLAQEIGLEVDPRVAVNRFRTLYSPDLTALRRHRAYPELDDETAELWHWINGLAIPSTADGAR